MTLTYTFVIPAYNESVRIRPTLDALLRHTQDQKWEAEILVVNDGSTDNTAQIVREYNRSHPQILLLENPGNRGKGYSVRNGMLHARGDICLFTDADLSSPIEEAAKLFDAIACGADIAIGSRWLRVEEVPVLWAHSEGTRLHPLRDGLKMFLEVLRIRWYAVVGDYTAAPVPSPGKL